MRERVMGLRKATAIRIVVIVCAVGLLEICCRTGVIRPYTMIAPSQMFVSMISLFGTRGMVPSIMETMTAVLIALLSGIIVGVILGIVLHAFPFARRIANPLLATYYSVPVFIFYPLFIVLFGLNAIPKTVIGFLYALVAVIINTLDGLDRVPPVFWKTARVFHLKKADTAIHVILPHCSPYLFAGCKLAIVYSFIGVVGSEFILSSGGLGYQISFAYNNFQNDVMYGLILFVLCVVVCINMSLYRWERILMERRKGR